MKPTRVFLALVFFCSVSLSFANVGAGAAFSGAFSTVPTCFASFTARSDDSPWCVFFNAHLERNGVTTFIDNWFISERLSEHVDYYVLWGLGFGAVFDEKKGEQMLATGSRLGAGLDFFFFGRRLEVFTQAVYDPYYGFKKSDGENWKPFLRPVNFPCTAGIRLWF